MKNLMKVIALIALALFANVGFAQDNKGQNAVAKMTARLTEKLQLTTEQQTKVTAIFTNQKANMKSMREQMRNATSREEKMKLRKAAWDKTDSDIAAVLTDEQKTKYAAYKEKMKEDWKESHNGGGRGKGGMRKEMNDDVY